MKGCCSVKFCPKCGKNLEVERFSVDNSTKDGLCRICKACRKFERMRYAAQTRVYSVGYRASHREATREYQRSYRQRNPNVSRDYKARNIDRIRERDRQYGRERHFEQAAYTRRKYFSDVNFRLTVRLASVLSLALKRGRFSPRTEGLVGCKFGFFRGYIESKFKAGMFWSNYGRGGWWLDHIRPYASFDLTDPVQLRECCHYTNLQPLWAAENISKGRKIL